MNSKSIIVVFAVAFLLAACQSLGLSGSGKPSDNNQAAPALNTDDHKQIDDAMQRAYTAPIGQQVTWNNPESGNAGTIIAVKDGYSQQGAYCRQFQETVTGSGQSKKSTEDFCQMPDGSWKPAQ